VLRLWIRKQGEPKSGDIEELTRFDEPIVQSPTKSVSEFNENIENAKQTFLAVFGHDLRTPMAAICDLAQTPLARIDRKLIST
jgi:signal transduction histidine kinase